MTKHRQRGRPKYRLTVKLDLEWDADLIERLASYPKGQRSEMVRQALRDAAHPVSSVELEAIRVVVADELSRALNGNLQPAAPSEHPADDVEARYGARLDKMLGKLSGQSP